MADTVQATAAAVTAGVAMPLSGTWHAAMVFLCGSIVLLVSWWGVHARGQGRLDRMRWQCGIGLLVLWLAYNAYYFSPAVFRWDVSLPLHVCDLLGIVSVLALLYSIAWMRAVLFFSALLLAGQALISPIGDQNPLHWRFWFYWLLHAGILAAFWFDVAVRRYVPTLASLAQVYLVDLAYVAVMVPIDIAMHWNYGYLGPGKPDVPTAIDLLGAWPLRVVWLVLLAMAAQACMLAGYMVVRRAWKGAQA